MTGWLTVILIIVAAELAFIWSTVHTLHVHMHEILEAKEKFGYKE